MGGERRERPETLLERITSLRALDVEVAFRATVAVLVPLIVLVALGRVDLAPYAAFGAMTSLCGRQQPDRQGGRIGSPQPVLSFPIAVRLPRG
ncbi:hypothetical protein SAMN05216282_104118 [Cryobacterium psychrotolerans]|uniref:Uncharacterized protein n=1 Tax=Cryobacterium psychrotolerans TaxID=386301 RepID=A0A1G9AJP5_9MICO|nr:hypothetical protein [Cryobacterium psychrotolerans]TFD89655.1 hypothetical protein E3T56_02960 [Cryobacterium psychrotolerans]SDK26790.1 hypothetical protein SAMN05216282_104118 [Cryobacterium psychrotolerans]